ncbi:MAG TPA: DNA-binding domain-containing protein, partial [Roseiflexaceae bacterium]|nr:DNA-binding domain-containing protein [Roseiflexaceae bacterium]
IEALESNFPVLAKLMGEAFFARLTQEYLLHHPSRHFSIRWFGDRLAQFLATYPDYREQPWLAELAEWEWRIAAAFDARDASILTVDDLAAITPERWPRLRFVVHPSVRRLSLTTNAAALAKAAGEGQAPPTPCSSNRTEWLIWRQDLSVQFRSLDAAEAAALDSALSAATFEEICEALLHYYEATDVPPRAASLLKRWTTDQILSSCMSD